MELSWQEIVGLTVPECQLQGEEGREGRRAGCCCSLLPCAQNIFLHGFPAAVIGDRISSNVAWCLQSFLRSPGMVALHGNGAENRREYQWQESWEKKSCSVCREVLCSLALFVWWASSRSCRRTKELAISGVTPPLLHPSFLSPAVPGIDTYWLRIQVFLSEDSQWTWSSFLCFGAT